MSSSITPQTLRIVPHLDSSHALVFPIMEYVLDGTVPIKIGRSIADRNISKTHMTFRSKVVSRRHAEIYLQDDKVYLRDVQSSSGTFLNNRRLCAPNQVSQPYEIRDNDIIQLGVDYQGGTQEIYRCVRMKLELNRANQNEATINHYNLKTYNSLRNLTTPPNHQMSLLDREFTTTTTTSNNNMNNDNNNNCDDDIHVDECCICLFAIAPFQALFVAPCSHTFHYKCLRPLLANHPGFLCPLCRKYADLDASVAVEVDEVKFMLTKMNIEKQQQQQQETTTKTVLIPTTSSSNTFSL